ncbi:fungal-specific transcription factor domain-containing protein [Annulohypoxylon bovei var. microspora]|nr:fungal-specific transcription factor domain-containing protein [Annulohypoxylon bovei var. microspora]
MSSEKRVRTYEEMSRETNGKDYAVCDQCRIKKIRCGREKPFCSNCTRLGHKCEWSGNGKKGNQTALLSHTIEGLSRRLESLEDALAETQNTVKRLASGASILTEAPVALQPSDTWPTPEDTSTTAYEAPIFKRPLGHFLRCPNFETTETYFDPTSLESLLYNIRDSILEPLVNENQNVRENALLAQQKFDLLVVREEKTVRNGILPTAPPISILKAMIEPYFADINPHFPIWTKKSFMRIATALQETDSSDQDLGRIVCSNNLILINLAANLLHPPHPDKSNRSKSARSTSSIDLDLTKGFLANAKRAIEHAELLLSPRLINVQALLSLCVVAQEHMSPVIFKRLFNMAAQCAKSIGLHDWERSVREQDDTRERQCVSYCLYVLDKTVCWTIGPSTSIPLSDVYIDNSSKSFDDMTMNDLVAKAKLAEIQEEVYLEIYACRAPARTEDQVRLMISRFNQKLRDWLIESGMDQEDLDNTASLESTSKIELSIGFTCTQLLYMWPFREHPDIISKCIEVSRRCMKLLLHLWCSSAELGHRGILPRILASHPPLYLYEIYAHVLAIGEEQDSLDVELLQSFVEMVESITDLQEENSYNRRLCEASSILMDVVAARNIQRKRRKTHHHSSQSVLLSSSTSPRRTRRASPFTPSSDVQAHYNENNTSPQIRNSQGTSSVGSSNFDPLLSPTDSGGCAGDQLATLIGSLGKGPFETFDLLGYSDPQISRGESLVEKEIWWD